MLRKAVIASYILLLLLTASAFAQQPSPPVQANYYDVIVESVHDADTFTVTIKMEWDVNLVHQQLRIANFDAWETSRARRTIGRITDEEIIRGKQATEYCVKLFKEAKNVKLTPHPKQKRDVYGRLLVYVYVDGVEYGELMRRNGFERH
jgi:endonuclease YncB( thermonuclease family)